MFRSWLGNPPLATGWHGRSAYRVPAPAAKAPPRAGEDVSPVYMSKGRHPMPRSPQGKWRVKYPASPRGREDAAVRPLTPSRFVKPAGGERGTPRTSTSGGRQGRPSGWAAWSPSPLHCPGEAGPTGPPTLTVQSKISGLHLGGSNLRPGSFSKVNQKLINVPPCRPGEL